MNTFYYKYIKYKSKYLQLLNLEQQKLTGGQGVGIVLESVSNNNLICTKFHPIFERLKKAIYDKPSVLPENIISEEEIINFILNNPSLTQQNLNDILQKNIITPKGKKIVYDIIYNKYDDKGQYKQNIKQDDDFDLNLTTKHLGYNNPGVFCFMISVIQFIKTLYNYNKKIFTNKPQDYQNLIEKVLNYNTIIQDESNTSRYYNIDNLLYDLHNIISTDPVRQDDAIGWYMLMVNQDLLSGGKLYKCKKCNLELPESLNENYIDIHLKDNNIFDLSDIQLNNVRTIERDCTQCTDNNYKLTTTYKDNNQFIFTVQRIKKNKKITYPIKYKGKLNILKIQIGSYNYKLKSFIRHRGSNINYGHYVNYSERDGQWYLFNDKRSYIISDITSILNNQEINQNIVLLLYIKEGVSESSTSLPLRASASSVTEGPETEEQINLLNYNIHFELFAKKTHQNAQNVIINFINNQQPDIMVLTEASSLIPHLHINDTGKSNLIQRPGEITLYNYTNNYAHNGYLNSGGTIIYWSDKFTFKIKSYNYNAINNKFGIDNNTGKFIQFSNNNDGEKYNDIKTTQKQQFTNRPCLGVKLEHKKSKKEYIIIGAHLGHNHGLDNFTPKDFKILIDQILSDLSPSDESTIIIMGDFNELLYGVRLADPPWADKYITVLSKDIRVMSNNPSCCGIPRASNDNSVGRGGMDAYARDTIMSTEYIATKVHPLDKASDHNPIIGSFVIPYKTKKNK